MAGIKLKEADAIHDVSLRKIDIAQQYLGVLSSVFEQESAMGKAIFLFQQGLAVASVWISTAQANAKAMAILALPPLWGPVVATNTANAAIQTGLIVAQTIGNFIGSSKKKKDYDTGGYTGDGGVYEPAGIVHRGEYVIPQWLVKNPALQPMIGMTEFLRRNKGLSGMQLNPLVQSGITAGGGYAAGGPISGIASGMQAPSFTIGSDPELKAINRALAEELRYLRENGIKAKVAGYGGEGSVADALTKIANLAKSVGLK